MMCVSVTTIPRVTNIVIIVNFRTITRVIVIARISVTCLISWAEIRVISLIIRGKIRVISLIIRGKIRVIYLIIRGEIPHVLVERQIILLENRTKMRILMLVWLIILIEIGWK